ncbi:Wadjet anti-phage system protein JetD domain-containing protein [Kribbella sp. NPDC023972]|uniref:Wadjet anti-phage system protein JetD domain-containing protein n=1 Tax=Kribbella sp. NPDC023972 TaxID=3154795 RepID=UPI003408872D
MRTPATVTDLISTRYHDRWRDWLITPPDQDALTFPLGAPSADHIARHPGNVDTWLRAWNQWDSEHPDLTLRRATKRTLLGEQQIITHLQAPTVDALASANPALTKHWRTARTRWQRLLKLHATPAVIKPHLRQIIDLDDADFHLLAAAAKWFAENPRSGLTPRQVPVEGMHTKWLKRHRRLVLAVLGLTPGREIPPDDLTDNTNTDIDTDDELPDSDLDLLGLLALPRHIDIILTDPADRSAIAGLRHLRAPIAEIAELPLRPSIVLVVENKESALLIPDHEGLVVIHSLGNHLDALTQLPWFNDASLLYWGDLDRPGITLLSRARALQPRLQSILMDPATVQTHLHLAVPERISRIDPPLNTLHPHEQAALDALTGALDGQHAQLEQERLPAPMVVTTILTALRN